MLKTGNFLSKHPIFLLTITLSLTMYFGYGLTKLETSNNQDSELPDDDSIVLTMNRMEEIFGEKDIILVGIEANDVFNRSTINKIKCISDEIAEIEGVIESQIYSLTRTDNITQREDMLDISPFLEGIPTDDVELQKLKQEVLSSKIAQGIIVSEDGTFTAVAANITEGYNESTVFDKVQAIVDKYQGPEVLHIAGDPIQQQEIDRGIKEDLGLLVPLAILLVIIGLLFSFRSAKGVFVPFLVIILTIIWTLGFMGHADLDMTVVSSLIPILMIVVSSSYGIHIVHRYYEKVISNDKPTALRQTIKGIAPAIIMTGITSAIGAISLLVFKVRSIREFGLITSAGVLFATFITLTFVPGILALLKQKKISIKVDKHPVMNTILLSIGNFSSKRTGLVMIITVIVLIVSGIGISKVKIGNDFSEYFPKDHKLRIAFNAFNNNLGGARMMDVVITGNEENAIKNPQLLQEIAAFQNYAVKLEGIGSTFSIADIVKRMNKELKNGNIKFDSIPDSPELVSEYLFLYTLGVDEETVEDLVDYNYQSAKIRMMLYTSEQDDHLVIYDQLKAYVDQHFPQGTKIEFGGDVMFWLAQIKYIVNGKIWNMLISIFTVMLFCMIIYRKTKVGIYSVIPLTVSSLITFGVMGFVGIRLDIPTAVITAIGIGIGVDFAIHFISRFKEEMKLTGDSLKSINNTITNTGKAIIFDAMSNIAGFSVFIFSGFMPIQYFGWLISLTMCTMVVSSLFLFPALFKLSNPYKQYESINTSDNKSELKTQLADAS